MGLRMDIHAPSVAAASQSTSETTNDDSKSLLELISEKDKVEAELKALSDVLESHGVDMNTSLITSDGFPRNDLDIAQIRTTRVRIIRLRNDYNALMSRIETGLHEHFANSKDEPPSSGPSQSLPSSSAQNQAQEDASREATEQPLAPFAIVNSIVSGSPADQAGLRAGDEICLFGDVNWLNHEKLAKVAQTVQRNEGSRIRVQVVRKMEDGSSSKQELELIPRSNWGGRGMLGCHLLPT